MAVFTSLAVKQAGSRSGTLNEMKALLDAHRASARKPLYPFVAEMPVAVEKTLAEHFESVDEYIYWPNQTPDRSQAALGCLAADPHPDVFLVRDTLAQLPGPGDLARRKNQWVWEMKKIFVVVCLTNSRGAENV